MTQAMVLQSIPEREIEVARLCAHLEAVPDGTVVTWAALAEASGVEMDTRGRAQARRALRRLRRPYAAVRGVGVELSSPENALTIMRGRFVRIDREVTRADRTRTELSTRHLEQMAQDDRNRMLMLAAFFGAVRTIARDARPKVIGANEPKRVSGGG